MTFTLALLQCANAALALASAYAVWMAPGLWHDQALIAFPLVGLLFSSLIPFTAGLHLLGKGPHGFAPYVHALLGMGGMVWQAYLLQKTGAVDGFLWFIRERLSI
jgi:hypothetical protein